MTGETSVIVLSEEENLLIADGGSSAIIDESGVTVLRTGGAEAFSIRASTLLAFA